MPRLRPGQVVVWDQLDVHKSERARALIEAAGCRLLFLPGYSPDFTPIEPAFAALKADLRRRAARTAAALERAIGDGLDAITPSDARGFFAHCRYPLRDHPFRNRVSVDEDEDEEHHGQPDAEGPVEAVVSSAVRGRSKARTRKFRKATPRNAVAYASSCAGHCQARTPSTRLTINVGYRKITFGSDRRMTNSSNCASASDNAFCFSSTIAHSALVPGSADPEGFPGRTM